MSTQIKELISELNDNQKQAVLMSIKENAMILAGAGSGKTKVLSTKIAYLVNEMKIPFERILSITFTNKAANEMKERIFKYSGVSNPRDIDFNIGTFHSIAHKFLRRYNSLFGISAHFHIIDQEDSFSIVKKIIKNKFNDDVLSSDKKFQKKIFLILGSNKEENIKPNDVVVHKGNNEEKIAKEVYKTYEDILERDNLVDFAGLLNKFHDGILSNAKLNDLFTKMFDIVFVDEFQDTNNVQYSLIKLLKSNGTSFFVVGDDDQSIYGFRGANYTNVRKYLNDFNVKPNAVVKLERNYRSTSNILEIANKIISNNTERLGKNLFTDKKPTSKVMLVNTYSDRDEAAFVAEKIKELISRGLVEENEIAILYRANYISRVFESALRFNNIRYKIYGGLSFYQRSEIKDFVAYLRLSTNLNSDLSFSRIINVPSRKIGDKTLEALSLAAQQNTSSLFEAIDKTDDKISKKFTGFVNDMQDIKKLLDSDNISLVDFGQKVLEITNFVSYYDDDSFDDRDMNTKELLSDMQDFEANLSAKKQKMTLTQKLSMFLSNVTLAGDKENQEDAEVQSRKHVSLMSVHGSKGLEFKTIFLVALENDVFPSGKEGVNIEEERRLMYVAVTRAKERLYLSNSQSRGFSSQPSDTKVRSMFIDEIPNELYLKHNYESTSNYKRY